jgi:hypothetical protein
MSNATMGPAVCLHICNYCLCLTHVLYNVLPYEKICPPMIGLFLAEFVMALGDFTFPMKGV